METNIKKYIWLGVAVAIAAIIIYFAAFGGDSLQSLSGKPKIIGEKTAQGIVAVPSTSPINEETEQVLTKEGAPVKQNVEPGAPEAPQQSNPITPESLPETAIKLEATSFQFTPSSFDVKKNAPVTLSVTGMDSRTHIFKFDDASLSAVAIGIGPGETRAITFNAPATAGEYKFHCDVPGHASQGMTGSMIVK